MHDENVRRIKPLANTVVADGMQLVGCGYQKTGVTA